MNPILIFTHFFFFYIQTYKNVSLAKVKLYVLVNKLKANKEQQQPFCSNIQIPIGVNSLGV